MKIGPTYYNDAGELMAPRPVDITLAIITVGGHPTTEAGFYHRFKFEGRTEDEFQDKLDRFVHLMSAVPGFMALVERRYPVQMGSFVRHGIDVIYVVECPTQRATAQRLAQRSAISAR